MIQLTEVKSSALKAFGYDPASRTLAIRFGAGKVFHYSDVPPDVAHQFATHESKGRAVGELIRGKFDHSVVLDEPSEGS